MFAMVDYVVCVACFVVVHRSVRTLASQWTAPRHDFQLLKDAISGWVIKVIAISLVPHLILSYLIFGVDRLLHLSSAEAMSVWPKHQPEYNRRSVSLVICLTFTIYSRCVYFYMYRYVCL